MASWLPWGFICPEDGFARCADAVFGHEARGMGGCVGSTTTKTPNRFRLGVFCVGGCVRKIAVASGMCEAVSQS